MLWPQRLSELAYKWRWLWTVLALLTVAWTLIGPALPGLPPAPPITLPGLPPAATGVTTATPWAQVEATMAPFPATEMPRAATEAPRPAATARSGRPNVIRGNLSMAGDLVLESALAWDDDSITIIEETRVGLIRVDEVTGEPHPGMAASWELSDDGKVFTFYLRRDVPWVKWNTLRRKVEQVEDCNGAIRMVTARDFAFGILHTIAYREDNPGYGYMLADAIVGGADYYFGNTDDPNSVGVSVIDDTTLQITFTAPGVFNLGALNEWLAMATPAWLVDGDACNAGLGDRWAEPTNLQTYGPFAVADWIKSMSLSLVPNPYWPGDEWTPRPQVEQVKFDMLDMEAALDAFEANTLDFVLVPSERLDHVQSSRQLSTLLATPPNPCSYAFAFNTQAQYVDDVRLRRALSLAIDRQAVADRVTVGIFQPAQWFAPPGVWAAPTLQLYAGLGIDYRPDEARALLFEYLGDTGVATSELNLKLTVNNTALVQQVAEAVRVQWANELGLDVEVVVMENTAEYHDLTLGPDAPQIWRAGWCADYPDAHAFVPAAFAPGEYFNATSPAGGLHWQNDAVDMLIEIAAIEPAPESRMGIYGELEHFLVYEDAAVIPLLWYTNPALTQPWIQRTFSSLRHERFEKWKVGP